MNDVIPPKKRAVRMAATEQSPPSSSAPVESASISSSPAATKKSPSQLPKKKRTITVSRKRQKKETMVLPELPDTIEVQEARAKELSLGPKKSSIRWVGRVIGLVVVLALITIGVGLFWYQQEQRPVDKANTSDVRVVIETGMSPEQIGAKLDENHLIRSQLAFDWYLRITRTGNYLQAGVYSLSQSMSLSEIVDHLKSGKTDTFRVTFLPGATVADNKKVLVKAGFPEEKVEEAFNKKYNHTILKSKPASADLEGYIYGETYEFRSDATIEQILMRSFDELEKVVATHNLEAEYKKQGLTLYKGITLASIVQREVPPGADQKKVASVFYNRLHEGMNLGSDVTYQYIADKTGQEHDPNLDSRYNTRRYTGLPPGPIAAPGKDALLAVAHPAHTSYLYFLSGDDDVTYFGRTEADHQRNIENHCKKKCQIL